MPDNISEETLIGMVTSLTDMGFSHELVTQALESNSYNLNAALQHLLNVSPYNTIETLGLVNDDTLVEESVLNESSSSDENYFKMLEHDHYFLEMKHLVQQKPELLHDFLQHVNDTNPELMEFINANQERFLDMLNGPVVANNSNQLESNQNNVNTANCHNLADNLQLTEGDRDAVGRLTAAGFPMHLALEAYLACEKCEEKAIRFLCDE